jgi:gamma-glutamyl-gamma-aminobutyrate hydrolase PuuD
MKNVIVTTRIYKDRNGILYFSYDKDILNLLKKLNLLIMPFDISNKIDDKLLKKCDGLFIMGGGNIDKIEKNELNKIRDNFEKKLFKYFLKTNKPIIAVCRGFQNIVSFYGIELKKAKGHVRKLHNLNLNKSRFVKHSKLKVNSYHDYIINKIPKDFSIISKTNDGSIEIAEHNFKKVLCLMFHPERSMPSKSIIIESIKNLF